MRVAGDKAMAILQAALALLFRSAGRLLNTVFGWATTMLFGKVPQDRQIYLSVIAFGSIVWIVAVLGIIVPSFATFLLAFMPLPAWVDHTWVRLGMLAAAAIVPLIVGVVSTLMLAPEQRPSGVVANLVSALKGYPYTVALALTLIMMTARSSSTPSTTWRLSPTSSRRWTRAASTWSGTRQAGCCGFRRRC